MVRGRERSERSERRGEVLNALTIGEIAVDAVMTPREEVVFLSTTASAAENLDRIGGSPHTRFPLVDDDLSDPDDVLGMVYVPSVVKRVDALREGGGRVRGAGRPADDARVRGTRERRRRPVQDANRELALVVDDRPASA